VISAGNDIVALNAIDKGRSCMPAFYSKFITSAELSLHNPAQLSLDSFIWLLWSVKESAYKYLKRTDNELVFSPIKLSVSKIEFIVDPDFVKPETDQLVDIFCSG
jgi:phosphopantetheinyl transferase (holo-ACP synthase)